VKFAQFCAILFNHVPFLRRHIVNINEVLSDFKLYKQQVPTYGAIILDPSLKKCLLVQGYYAKSSWGFPKGKVNHEEDPLNCAVREVFEETGFDCTDYIRHDSFIEKNIRDTTVRLYVVANVPLATNFQPQTRCEIRAIEWFEINMLPSNRTQPNSNNFFMVMPFLKDLRQQIAKLRRNPEPRAQPTAQLPSMVQFLPQDTKPREQKPTQFFNLYEMIGKAAPDTPVLEIQSLNSEYAVNTDNEETRSPMSIANIFPSSENAANLRSPARKPRPPFMYRTTRWENVSLTINWANLWKEVYHEVNQENCAF